MSRTGAAPLVTHADSSCPALCRASTPYIASHIKDVDGRDIGERSDAVLRTAMPGHDDVDGYDSSEAAPLPAPIPTLFFALLDGRLEREAGVPGEEDPGVLRHFGDEGIDHRLAQRLGVDAGEMRLGQDLAHQLGGAAGGDPVGRDPH